MRLRDYKSYWLALGIFFCAGHPLLAQQPKAPAPPAAPEVTVRAGFAEDSLFVGKTVNFYLTAHYDRKLNLLFPDTTFNFSPFEFKDKTYFTTHTEGGKSYDSIVYHLTTFEVDTQQYLSLPVFQVNPQDCTIHLSNQDSIRLAYVVKTLPDSLANIRLKMNVAYQDVPYGFNVQLWVIVTGLLFMTAAVLWFIFGKKIRRHYRLKRMHKAYTQFLDTYTREVAAVAQAFSTTHTETALIVWKRYMEQLDNVPYTKLTTKEIILHGKNDALGQSLRTTDGAIYGHDTAVMHALEHLKTHAIQQFTQKIQEVTNG